MDIQMKEEFGSEGNYTSVNPNPLLVDLVLDKVIAYLPREDLRRAREVCYKWNEFATSEMLKQPQKSLYFQENMIRFLEVMKASENIPFANFALCLGRFATVDKMSVLEEFFTICGPTLKKLELQMDCRTIGINFNGFASPFPKKEFNSLETLKIWYDTSIDKFIGQEQLSYFDSFLNNDMGNLKSLTFFNYSPIFENQVVTDLLCIFIAENTFPHLKEMTLQAKITNENLKNLSEMKINLRKIQLLFKNSDFDSNILTPFLQSQKNSLETFKLDAQILCELPQLNCLIILDVNTSNVLRSPFCYENRNKFPRLKKIKLAAPMLHQLFQTPQRCCAFPTVEKLHFYKHFDNNPGTVIPNIATMFPNLKKLRLKFTPNWVISIFENLVNLEELFIDENNLIDNEHDTVFTGMSSESCETLKSTKYTKDTDIEDLRINASLTNLKKLKIFRLINLNRMSNGSKCTDISGYFAFLRLPNLKSVVTYLNGFSDECLAEMGQQFEITSSLDYLRRKQI